MGMTDLQILEQLDKEDQKKVAYFLELLLEQSKYQRTKEELLERRMEIQEGDTLTHDEIWSQIGV